jgi:predicted amidohydrolase YtcJ
VALAESVPAAEALAMYTTRAAFVDWADDETGSLTAGRLADFTVLAADPLEIAPEMIGPDLVVATVTGGVAAFIGGAVLD